MKTIKNIFGVLALIFAIAALALFFVPYGDVVYKGLNEVGRAGAEFAFGSDFSNGAAGYNSAHLLFNMVLIALTVVFAAASVFWKKAKNIRWATIAFSIVTAVYMLVIACKPASFLDLYGIVPEGYAGEALKIGATPFLIAAASFLTFVTASVYLLAADKLAVLAAGEGALTIPQKVVKFLKDYKGEIKKIVWPGPRAVVKNTLIVLVICLIVGAFIWAVDFGLGALLDLIYG